MKVFKNIYICFCRKTDRPDRTEEITDRRQCLEPRRVDHHGLRLLRHRRLRRKVPWRRGGRSNNAGR